MRDLPDDGLPAIPIPNRELVVKPHEEPYYRRFEKKGKRW